MTNKIGVMVVHGIGDPTPGDTLQSLTDSLLNARYAEGAGSHPEFEFGLMEEHQLPMQPDRKEWKAGYFPLFLRRCEVARPAPTTAPRPSEPKPAAQEYLFAEVFWGSASQLPIGIWGTVAGIMQLFFRSIVILKFAEIGSSKAKAGIPWLRRIFFPLAHGISYLLTGPILALNVMLLLALLLYKYFGWVRFDSDPNFAIRSVLYSSLLAASVAVIVLIVDRKVPDTLLRHLALAARWMIAALLVWSLLAVIVAPKTIDASAMLLIGMLGVVFFVTVCAMILLIIGRGAHWLFSERSNATSAHFGSSMTVALFTVMVQFTLWVTIIPTIWKLLLTSLSGEGLPDILYDKAAQSDGVQWIAVGLIALFGLLSLLLRLIKTNTILAAHRDTGPNAQSTDRLIVSSWLSVSYALILLVTIIFVFAVSLAEVFHWKFAGYETVVQPLFDRLKTYGITTVVASLTLVVIPMISGSLRQALDLVNDIISYIDQNNRAAATHEVKAPSGRYYGYDIRARFRLVLEYLLQREQISQLVIIAHSQGSVIALDELADTQNDLLESLRGKITFVTLGSPISHLYQYYFSGGYPAWKDAARWSELFQRLQRWRHYYRIDDFVGAELSTDLGDFVKDFEQEGISVGGHVDYFRDDRFISELRKLF